VTSCEVHVCVSPTPSRLRQIEFVVTSIRRSGGVWSDADFVATMLPNEPRRVLRDAARRLTRSGVEVRPVPRSLWRRHGVRAGLLSRYQYQFQRPNVLLLDTDVICTGRLDELHDLVGGGFIAGLVAHVSPLALDIQDQDAATFWNRLYASAGLPAPECPCRHSGWEVMDGRPDRRWCPPYFNDGVLAMDRSVATALGEVIFDELRVALEFTQGSWYAHQLACSLAIARTGVGWKELALRFNMPNDLAFWERHPEESADVRLIHYLRRDELDRDGDLADPVALERLLARTDLGAANQRVQEAFAASQIARPASSQ
jgi:hypothetical protein